jgi:hypothetical protein
MNKWTQTRAYDAHYEPDADQIAFAKELSTVPDDSNTRIAMRLVFDLQRSDCYYHVLTLNDNEESFELGDTFDIPWTVGLAMLTADGIDIPEALKEKTK